MRLLPILAKVRRLPLQGEHSDKKAKADASVASVTLRMETARKAAADKAKSLDKPALKSTVLVLSLADDETRIAF